MKADASGDDKVTFDEYMKSMGGMPPALHRSVKQSDDTI